MQLLKKKDSKETLFAVASIRALLIDMINKANSGHPGMALDATPAMVALFRDHLVADPSDPKWINRDRLVFSSGHVSALLYSMLHVSGYALSLDDLKNFRQLGSLTPGHPEVTLTPGVDATSGPLGQGIAQAVGMAIAEKAVAAQYPNSGKFFGHYTYVLCGDGCLEEGISHEAISLAGHYRLNKLILLADLNTSTLDGPTSDSEDSNLKLRFLAENWNVIEVQNGDSVEEMSAAIAKAKKETTYPSVILFHTVIGKGSKNEGSCKTHGSPLGEEDGAYAKKSYGYDEPPFTVKEEVYALFESTFKARGQKAHEAYNEAKKVYASYHPEEMKRFDDAFEGKFENYLPASRDYGELKAEATRASSGKFLERLYASCPFTFGGSADVAGSTKTNIKGSVMFSPTHPEGRDVHFGIREFGMASAVNGILLHGGLLPYCALFFVFTDYCKPAIRMAAMEEIPSIFLFTHDSLAVGEDGATHEPIEHLAALRAIPNLQVIRPADAKETEGAWKLAVKSKKTPTALILSRQNLPILEETSEKAVEKGGYLVRKVDNAALTILATGSEVSLALDAAKILEGQKILVNVVSMPCLERFLALDEKEQDAILCLPRDKCVSLEMGSTFGWGDLAKFHIGVDTYGASGKDKDVLAHFGFTKEEVAKKVASFLK